MKITLLAVSIAVFSLTSCQNKQLATADSKEVTLLDFQAFISQPGTLNIVEFGAEWCGTCKQLEPILSDVVARNSDIVRLGLVDWDKEPELIKRQAVRVLPDVRFYIDGKMVSKFTGVIHGSRIEKIIATHLLAISQADSNLNQASKEKTEPSQIKAMEIDSLAPEINLEILTK